MKLDYVAIFEKYSKNVLDSKTLSPDVDADEYILLQSLIVSLNKGVSSWSNFGG